MFTPCSSRKTQRWSSVSIQLHCLFLFLCVCLPVPPPLSNSIFEITSIFFCSHPTTPSLLPPCSRSQSLRNGPVSSWIWTQRWRPQPQKPLGPRAQRNSKLLQSVPSSTFSRIPPHWLYIFISATNSQQSTTRANTEWGIQLV